MEDEIIFDKLNPNIGFKYEIKLINNVYYLPGWLLNQSDDIQIKLKNINKDSIRIGFNSLVLYDTLVLGITNIRDRPKCPICGENLKFINFKSGYKKTCGKLDCLKLSIKNTIKKLWNNTDYRALQIQSHKDWASSDENKTILKLRAILAWSNPIYKERLTYSHEIWAAIPENKEKMRLIGLLNWKNIRYRRQLIKSHIEWAKANPNKIYCGRHGFLENLNKCESTKINYDSTWEKLFLEYCSNSNLVKTFDRANFSIPYDWKNENHNYFPDFKIVLSNDYNILVEIKANWQILLDDRTAIKLDAGEKFVKLNNNFQSYLVLTEDLLFGNNSTNSINITLLDNILTNLLI